jgi:hypothetical protein
MVKNVNECPLQLHGNPWMPLIKLFLASVIGNISALEVDFPGSGAEYYRKS